MKRIHYYAALAMLIGLPLAGRSETLVYKVTMRLYVPRVYDNTQSLGYRKPQWQKIVGYVSVDKDMASRPDEDGYVSGEPEIYAYSFVNKKHKLSNGEYVTYADCALGTDVMWRYIGSNAKNVFKTTCVEFSLDLDPSYNIGDDEPDNTLIVQFSGIGSSEKSIRGGVTGQIGCGCSDYGHKSPTRDVLGDVSDITPLYGTFNMKLEKRIP